MEGQQIKKKNPKQQFYFSGVAKIFKILGEALP